MIPTPITFANTGTVAPTNGIFTQNGTVAAVVYGSVGIAPAGQTFVAVANVGTIHPGQAWPG